MRDQFLKLLANLHLRERWIQFSVLARNVEYLDSVAFMITLAFFLVFTSIVAQ